MAPLSLTDTVAVKHTTKRMPQLGFGVWTSPRDVCVTSCQNALKAGYRHIDTAQGYKNEAEVGEAVQKSGISREDIWITTKFVTTGKTHGEMYESVVESVKKCDPREGGYVDLFLIHMAKPGKEGRRVLWEVLERLKEEGKAKTIGVSNWGPNHLEELKAYAKSWPPSVNQIELHPWTQQKEVVKYCQENDIVVEAYCPIARNQKADDPTLSGIAKDLGVTPNQVLLRYSLQKGWVPLPKSDNPDRMKMNADLYGFEITDEQMAKLDALDQGEEGACCPENIPDNIA